MAFSDKTLAQLWSQSGNRCAICKTELIRKDDDGHFNISNRAHIISSRPTGPRHDSSYEDYDGYDNLILLCANHHAEVDERVDAYTVMSLRDLKQAHERWVKITLEGEPLDSMKAEIIARFNDKLEQQREKIERLQTGLNGFENYKGREFILIASTHIGAHGNSTLRDLFLHQIVPILKGYKNIQEFIDNSQLDYQTQQELTNDLRIEIDFYRKPMVTAFGQLQSANFHSEQTIRFKDLVWALFQKTMVV